MSWFTIGCAIYLSVIFVVFRFRLLLNTTFGLISTVSDLFIDKLNTVASQRLQRTFLRKNRPIFVF